MLTLRAVIQEIPPDNKGGHDLKRDEIETTAESFDDARASLRDEVAEKWSGWRIIALMTIAGGHLDGLRAGG